MQLELFTQLYERIQVEPSILLLGQNYLSMGEANDLIWKKLVIQIYPNLDLPHSRADYPALWQQAVKNEGDAQKVMKHIAEASRGICAPPAVAAMTNLRWSLVYTSAIDDSEAMTTAQGYTVVPLEERTAKPQYLNKERHYRVNLCGSAQCPPPVLHDKVCQSYLGSKSQTKLDGLKIPIWSTTGF